MYEKPYLHRLISKHLLWNKCARIQKSNSIHKVISENKKEDFTFQLCVSSRSPSWSTEKEGVEILRDSSDLELLQPLNSLTLGLLLCTAKPLTGNQWSSQSICTFIILFDPTLPHQVSRLDMTTQTCRSETEALEGICQVSSLGSAFLGLFSLNHTSSLGKCLWPLSFVQC